MSPRQSLPWVLFFTRRGYHAPAVQRDLFFFRFGAWRSLVAHLHGVQGVASSNLAAPTIHLLALYRLKIARRAKMRLSSTTCPVAPAPAKQTNSGGFSMKAFLWASIALALSMGTAAAAEQFDGSVPLACKPTSGHDCLPGEASCKPLKPESDKDKTAELVIDVAKKQVK